MLHYYQPLRSCRSSMPKQNSSHHDHVVCDGSHFWIFLVIFPNLIFYYNSRAKILVFCTKNVKRLPHRFSVQLTITLFLL